MVLHVRTPSYYISWEQQPEKITGTYMYLNSRMFTSMFDQWE